MTFTNTSNNISPVEEEKIDSMVKYVEEDIVNETGILYLYGEQHGKKAIIEKELELWKQYYHEESMRHLFLEMPYFTAELLNVWMSEDSDKILDDLDFDNWGADQEIRAFYKEIKTECPETVFHGTDIGHNYLVNGIKYRNYLEDNDLVDSQKYRLNEEAIQQGKYFNGTGDDIYRESKMVENLTREFNMLNDQSIMGIYGAAHISLEPYTRESQTVETMAYQLSKIYGDRVITEDLKSEIIKSQLKEPISIDEIEVAGKTYQASYFGKMDIVWSTTIKYIEFWRLDNAYEDLKNLELTGETYTYDLFPMVIEDNQIYMFVATVKDDTTITVFALTDGEMVDGMLITKQILIDQ